MIQVTNRDATDRQNAMQDAVLCWDGRLINYRHAFYTSHFHTNT